MSGKNDKKIRKQAKKYVAQMLLEIRTWPFLRRLRLAFKIIFKKQ